MLTAVALSGGAVTTTAIVSHSIVSAAETMADQYDPFYDDTTIRAVSRVPLYPQGEKRLPSGTTFHSLIQLHIVLKSSRMVQLWLD